MKTIKSWITNIVLGLISSAIFAFFVAPDQQVQIGSLAFGLVAIPLALLIGSAALALYGLYLVIHIVEVVAVKLHLLDFFDGGP